MRIGLVVVVLAGCGRLGFDPLGRNSGDGGTGDGIDAPPDAPCVWSAWSAPVELTTLNTGGYDDYDGAISRDGLTLYFESNRPGTGQYDLYVSTRSAIGATWQAPVQMTALNSVNEDSAPKPTVDGLHLYFTSDRLGAGHRLFRADRASTAAPFSGFQQVPELAGEAVIGPTLSEDGSEMIYASYNAMLDLAWATSSGGVFTPQGWITELDTAGIDGYPTLSRDGLTMYFESTRDGNSRIYETTRTAVGATWGAAVMVPQTAGNAVEHELGPELSSDGSELYFASNRVTGTGAFDLYVSTRTCQ